MTTLIVAISARAAAESAIRSGYGVQALDVFGDTDLMAACPAKSLLFDFAESHRDVQSTTVRLFLCSLQLDFDDVVYGSGFENHPECVKEWERLGKTVLGNDSETLAAVRDWARLFDSLDRWRIDHPETYFCQGLQGCDIGAIEPSQFIVKPASSGGGHGIRALVDVLKSPDMLASWWNRPVLVQRRLRGTLASASFVSGDAGFRLLSTTLQLAGNPFSPFRYSGNIAPLDAPHAIGRRMAWIAKRIATGYDLKGCNGLDFMIVRRRVHVLEVNPRLQGSLEVVEPASGTGVYDAHVRACRGQPIRGARRSRGYWGRRIVFAPNDLVVRGLGDLDSVRDIPRDGSTIQAGMPICTVLAHSDTGRACGSLLQDREKRVISFLTRAA